MNKVKFNYLIKKYNQDIFRFAYYMLKSKTDAEDITQDVFLRTWENLDKFKFSKAKQWMIKTTYNMCIDFFRKRKLTDELFYYKDDEEEFELIDNDVISNPIVKIENNLLKERIEDAIQKLPEKLKTIFIMYEINELKHKEIAKLLNVPINSVKVYLMRARKQLQIELKQYETK